MWTALLSRLRSLLRRSAAERDLDVELQDHLAHQIQWHIEHGVPADRARRQALVDLGGRDQVKEECRDERGVPWLENLWRDVRYAIRTFRKSPGFFATAVLSLALGLGANIVVFGILHALLLKPLPIHAPEQVVYAQDDRFANQSYPNYRDLRDRTTTLSGLAAYRIAPMGLGLNGTAEVTWGYLATGNYFEVLGIRPWAGRLFTSVDDSSPGSNAVVVVSYPYWQRRLSGDMNVIGQTVRINSRNYTLLGVLPPGFYGTERFYQADVWAPMSMQAQIEGGRSWLESRQAFNVSVIGRLRPEATRSQATADLNGIAAELTREYPNENAGLAVHLTSPGWMGDSLGAPVSAVTHGLMGLAALVLLAACANLASLLLARATDRHREIAIRLAIGASRRRIVEQLLVESLVLAAVGGTAGMGLAIVLLQALTHWRAPLQLPVQFDLTADWTVLAFAGVATLVTGLICGLTPARTVGRTDLARAARGTTQTTGLVRRWATRDVLVTLQVAICCVLVFASFAAARGMSRALTAPLGIRPDGVDLVGFDLGLAGYPTTKGRLFQQHVLEAALALPGVTSAAFTSGVPLHIDQSSTTVFGEHAVDLRQNAGTTASIYFVSPRYFATIGTRVLEGRDFAPGDDAKSVPVAIVNRVLARRLFGNANPLGAEFRRGAKGDTVTVVGVVEDGKYVTIMEDPRPAVFLPATQIYAGNTDLLVRMSPGQASVANDLRRLIAHADPDVPVYSGGTANDILSFAFFPTRMITIGLSTFGILAVMLALTGTFGLATYAVSRRLKEIGIRVAVGAKPSQVLRAILGRIAMLVVTGTSIGLVVAILISPLMKSLIYGTSIPDPTLVGAVITTMALLGVASAWLPARRALAIDAVTILKVD